MTKSPLVLCALLATGCGIGPVEDALSHAFEPMEPDARARQLLIASGAGHVSEVRRLPAQGVRAEPEMLAAAVTGAFESRRR